MTAPLQGIFTLDISTTPAGAWCSRLLAGFGAEVLVAEPAGRSPIRRLGPFDADGESIPAAYWSVGKRFRTIDREAEAGRRELVELARSADVVVSSATPTELEALGLTCEAIGSPALVLAHVTPWGFESRMAETPGNDLTVAARSGWAFINGLASREPLQPSAWQASYCGGLATCIAVIAALHQRNETGAGQEVDVSLNDAMLATYSAAFLRGQYSGEPWGRKAVADLLAGPVPVKDGYFSLTISRAHFWRDSMNLLGLPDLADDPRWETGWYRQAHKDEYVDRVQAKMATWGKQALFDELAARRVVAGPVLTMAELVENQHLRAREFWEHDKDGKLWPGAPLKLSATPWRPVGDVAGPAEQVPVTPAAPAPNGSARRPKGPLEGVQAMVLTQAWAGTFCTELLGLMGADVVQVEVRKRLDSWRGTYDGPIPEKLKQVPTAQHAWNCNPLYNSVNLNKRCVTLDLQDPRGREVYLRLVEHADVVAENFSPRVLGNLGLTYETLKSINPRVIVCSLSAYGHDGPWANIPGIGGTIEPTSGMSALLGYRDGPPMNSGQMYPDPVAGYYGAAAILAALHHRDRTGQGQYIDLSMQEANLTFVGDAALEYLRNGTQRLRLGNRHMTFAPHGIYPCEGEEQWVAIAAETGEQWQALAALTGLGPDRRFVTNEARKMHEDELDAAIAAWTRERRRDAIVERLTAAGVPAAPVLHGLEIAGDELARASGILVDVEHAEAGPTLQLASPFRFSGADPVPVRAAPLLGEHSFEVFQEFLGMTQAEYDELVAAGISGTGPPATAEKETANA